MELDITIRNDTTNEDHYFTCNEDGYCNKNFNNTIDCGLHVSPSNASEDVVIADCEDKFVGYICVAGIPDAEAYDIHPELRGYP